MEWLGWLKQTSPTGKEPTSKSENPETELVELIRKSKNTQWVKCELDCTNLRKVLHIFTALMATGKTGTASEFCKQLVETCFDKTAENPYRLVFLTFAMIAECETRFYDLNMFALTRKDISLKLRYSLSQEAFIGMMQMDPTLFKIPELLNACEELLHFSCFRQCHVNLFKNLSQIGPDENVDWFDRVKVLDSNILALINDSDIMFRFCDSDKEKREFTANLQRLQTTVEYDDQLIFSWFNHLHHREVCVRALAAAEVLKVDKAFKAFTLQNIFTPRRRLTEIAPNVRRVPMTHFRKLGPRNPELEAVPKKVSSGNDSGFFSNTNMVVLNKNPKPHSGNKKPNPQTIYSTSTDGLNYCVPLFDNQKTFTDLNADALKEKSKKRKERQKAFSALGPTDLRKRLPSPIRTKIRMILRKMMAEGREMQKKDALEEPMLDKAFPVSDDDCSDEEIAVNPFRRTETLEGVRRKRLRKFGKLNPKSEVKHVLWYHNARDELLATRAIPNHCAKIKGGSSEPFGTFEGYLGVLENGGNSRDRFSESNREAETRHFSITRETGTDDGSLLTFSPVEPFKKCPVRPKQSAEVIGLNSLLLQNMRRRCIDELLIILMIIRGQEQLQEGNVIRCFAYIMLIDYKFAFLENSEYGPAKNNNFYPHLIRLRKHLFSKFRLYGTDVFGSTCTTMEEELSLCNDGGEDLNLKCFQFCRDTRAHFFCICIRGKIIELKTNELGESAYTVDRNILESHHEFFFSLEAGTKGSHLNQFWGIECAPIVSALIHMQDHGLVSEIDNMERDDAEDILNGIPGLSSQTRKWLNVITKNGYMRQDEQVEVKPPTDPNVKKSVPMLFQLPSKNNADHITDDMVDSEKIYPIYEATTEFVREKYMKWKEACKADKANLGKTNRDQMYNAEKDLMFYGEAIEKDVYMVAVYQGEKMSEEGNTISSKMHFLCRKLRSQAAFISTPICHTEEGSTV
ncbi:unnamed protein product [Caenorhabditis brenneri]